jgi:hypothetical protein
MPVQLLEFKIHCELNVRWLSTDCANLRLFGPSGGSKCDRKSRRLESVVIFYSLRS